MSEDSGAQTRFRAVARTADRSLRACRSWCCPRRCRCSKALSGSLPSTTRCLAPATPSAPRRKPSTLPLRRRCTSNSSSRSLQARSLRVRRTVLARDRPDQGTLVPGRLCRGLGMALLPREVRARARWVARPLRTRDRRSTASDRICRARQVASCRLQILPTRRPPGARRPIHHSKVESAGVRRVVWGHRIRRTHLPLGARHPIHRSRVAFARARRLGLSLPSTTGGSLR